jgi:hypothetical protein
MARKTRRTKDGLQSRIEREQSSGAKPEKSDSVDPEIGGYIDAFLKGLPDAVVLEKFSLATPEEAKKALVAIDETMQRLNRQLANARALQQLVRSSDASD